MPLVASLWFVDIRSPAVHDMVVVDELDLPWLQVHTDIELRICGHSCDQVHRLDGFGGQPGRFGVSLRSSNIGRNKANKQAVVVFRKGREHVKRLAARRLFATKVIWQWPIELLSQIRSGPDDLVMNIDSVCDQR